ncbi:MAG: hypothetical protein ACRC0I_04395, partial [Sediminibacterium sp.]
MNKPLTPCLIGILIAGMATSCIKIPTASVQLVTSLQTQGNSMHELNIILVNALFAEKKAQVSSFIQQEYTPSIIDNYFKKLPNLTFTKKETAEIIGSLIPEINKQKDDMLTALEQNRVKLVTRLDNDHIYFVTGSNALKDLLASAGKLQDANTKLDMNITKASGGKINMAAITKALDKLVVSGGDLSSKINSL